MKKTLGKFASRKKRSRVSQIRTTSVRALEPIIAGIIISAIILLPQDAFSRGLADKFRLLCDAAFVSAVILLGGATLVWLSQMGMYGNFTKAVKNSLLPFLNPHGDKVAKQKEKEKTQVRFIAFGGLFYGVLSAIFYMLYSVNV
ncbi:MAG: hypothetical protein LBD16_09275 [Oscillospiraceae bacterium]|nr:hypothetical protein [Oscillospiraceae bacterium]